MIEKIQHATASSPEGAKGLVKGVLACAFQNMAFMLPHPGKQTVLRTQFVLCAGFHNLPGCGRSIRRRCSGRSQRRGKE